MFACRRLVGACRAHTVVVKMCASTCCRHRNLCGVFLFFLSMLQLFRPKWNGCTVIVLRTVVHHAFCSTIRFRAVHGRRLTSRGSGCRHPNQLFADRNCAAERQFKKKKKVGKCAVNWGSLFHVARIRRYVSSSSSPYIANHSQLHLTNGTMCKSRAQPFPD